MNKKIPIIIVALLSIGVAAGAITLQHPSTTSSINPTAPPTIASTPAASSTPITTPAETPTATPAPTPIAPFDIDLSWQLVNWTDSATQTILVYNVTLVQTTVNGSGSFSIHNFYVTNDSSGFWGGDIHATLLTPDTTYFVVGNPLDPLNPTPSPLTVQLTFQTPPDLRGYLGYRQQPNANVNVECAPYWQGLSGFT
jgi:hypothetical protein